MEKRLYLQSEHASIQLKHFDDNDTFSLSLLIENGDQLLRSFSREEFEQLGEAINYLLKSKNTERLLNIESDISRSTAELELSRNRITSLEAEISTFTAELELLKKEEL